MNVGLFIIISYVFLLLAVDEHDKEAYNEIEAQLEEIKAMLLKVREAIPKESVWVYPVYSPIMHQTVERYANISDALFDQKSSVHREAGFPRWHTQTHRHTTS